MAAPGPLPPGQTRDALVAEVRASLGVLTDGAAVLVACSGGPDSTALAFLAAEARPDLDLTLVHVSHGWRDDAADAALVARHAGWLGCEVAHLQVVASAIGGATDGGIGGATDGAIDGAIDGASDTEVAAPAGRRPEAATGDGGPEASARAQRYRLLREEASRRAAAAILVGHSAEDQAETLLLRLARGTGPTGLAGMAIVAGDLLRPLLRVRRADLRRFVTLEGLPVADDPTNADPAVRRVRVRHEVLPALSRIGPDPVGALARLADLQRDDLDALELAAASLEPHAVRWFGGLAVLDRAALDGAPRAVASRVVRRVLRRWLEPAPSAAVVTSLLAARPGDGVALPRGLRCAADARWLTVGEDAPVAEASSVEVPGTTALPAIGAVLHARTPEDVDASWPDPVAERAPDVQLGLDLAAAGGTGVAPAWQPPRVVLDPALVPPGGAVERLRLLLPALEPKRGAVPGTGSSAAASGEVRGDGGDAAPDPRGQGGARLGVRPPRPGDRLDTGAGGRRVATLLADVHVPRALRARWPVVTLDGVPVWLPGLAADATLLREGAQAPAISLHLGAVADRD